MEKKLFKIKFKIRCYYGGGIYSYADAYLSVFAESEGEAKRKLRENTSFEITRMEVVKTVEYNH